MSLDFIASLNPKKINENTPVFSLVQSEHNKIFDCAKPLNKFPIIAKFYDYYSDTTILYGEIQPLIKELDTLIKSPKLQSPTVICLISFLKTAFDNELNIYVYCD